MTTSNKDLLLKYFPELTASQLDQYEEAVKLYTYWNDRINVVSRKDIENITERHILHSLAVAKIIKFHPGAEILDIGTGGGFPGIPLAIFFPETEFHLVDSINKKITVVKEVAQGLSLKNVRADHKRAEEIKHQYDFVTSRAVARLQVLLSWIPNKTKSRDEHLINNGLITLKGGDLEEELIESGKKSTVYDIPTWFEEEFFETKKVVYTEL